MMTTKWKDRYALRTGEMSGSAIREILKITQQPDVLSLAGGMPAPELFPVEEIQAACRRVLEKQGAQALQYSITEGYPPLRRFIVEKMAEYGIVARDENILIIHGSQQGLDLIGKVFLNRGDVILLEAPSYLGAIQAWRPYEPRFETVSIDEDGMRVDLVEEILIQKRPKLIYALPNFQNPAGTTLPLERRERLVELANHYGVPVVEDDPYGELRYSGDHIAPLVVLDAEWLQTREQNGRGYHEGNVLYLSTFSKTLAPGFRLGWIVAPVDALRKLVEAKQGTDLHTNTFGQMVAYEVIKDGFLKRHVAHLREVYQRRRDTMIAAMEEHFPEGVSWTVPDGGLFLWVVLPQKLNAEKLLAEAVEKEKVAFVPGQPFYTDEGKANAMRLNFSMAPPDQIEVGIERLGRAIRSQLDASVYYTPAAA